MIDDQKKDKKHSWILWSALGLIIIAVLAEGFDIGDSGSPCSINQIARVNASGKWSCINYTVGNTTNYYNISYYNVTNNYNVTNITNTYNYDRWNITGSEGLFNDSGILDANTSYIQRRVIGTCGADQSIDEIFEDGTVACESDDDNQLTQAQVQGYMNVSTYFIFLEPYVLTSELSGKVGNWSADKGSYYTIADILALNSSWNYTIDTNTDTNASTACVGTTTYLDGEGNCDDISGVYLSKTGDTATGNYTFDSGILHIDSTNNLVGIGTTSPVIGGSVTANNGYWATGVFAANPTTAGAGFDYYEGGGNEMRIFSDGVSGNGNISFYRTGAGGNLVMRMDGNTGDVGIGTDTPNTKLNINGGGISITNSSAAFWADSNLNLELGSYNGIGYVGHYDRTALGYYPLYLYGSQWTFGNSAVRMIINGTGHVGIGTTPFDRLTVGTGSGTENIAIYSSTTGYGRLRFSDVASGVGQYAGAISYDHSGNDMYFSTSSTSRMVIDDSGKVGIGTNTPGGNLEIYATGAPDFLRVNMAGQGQGIVFERAGGSIPGIQSYSNADWTTATPLALQAAGDNVGIGTTNPSGYKLYVVDTADTNTAGLIVEKTDTTSSTRYGGIIRETSSRTAGSSVGLAAQARTSAASVGGAFTGLDAIAYTPTTWNGSATTAMGINTNVFNNDAGTFSNMMGIKADVGQYSTGTVTNAISAYLQAPFNSGGGTMTNAYTLYVESPTGGTNKYSIYQTGTEKNYLQADTGIGTNSPAVRLEIENTAIDGNVLRLQDSDGICDHNPEAGAETVVCASDTSLKSDIEDINITKVIDKISKINVRSYTVNASGDRMAGVIAQELLLTNPEMVHNTTLTSCDTKIYTTETFNNITNQTETVDIEQKANCKDEPLLMVEQPNIWELVAIIQEQHKEIDSLKIRIKKLEEK